MGYRNLRMASEKQDSQQRLILIVIFCLICLVVGIVIGFNIYQRRNSTQELQISTLPAAVVSAALNGRPHSAIDDSAAQAASDAATIEVESGIVKFYFASGNAELGAGAGDALAGLIKNVSNDRKVIISGFHDVTGNAAKNVVLANLRALAVRVALVAAGVAEQQIELKKPLKMTASGSNAEARRVEVSLE